MRRVATVLLLVILTLALVPPPAEACLECVALGLASFAVFTQLVAAVTAPPVVYAAPAYYAPPAYYGSGYYGWGYPATPAGYYPAPYYPARAYAAYPATYAAAAPATSPGWTGPRVVQYAHGRYELRGDGVTVPWAWVWIPSVAPVPANPDGPEGSGGSRTP
jgi:hypothetical protein